MSYTRNFKSELRGWTVGSIDKKNKGEVFFLDTRDGKTRKVNLENFKILIANDQELLDEMAAFDGDKQEKIFIF